jgi:hypothetical protein
MPLRIPRAIKRVAVAFAITVAVIGAAYYYAITPHRPSAPPQSDESLLFQADTLSWGNRWEDALPLYRRAQQLFLSQHNASKALYAEVSEILPDKSISIRQPILPLPRDLATPEAQDPETKLRVLTIRGMLEVHYDAAEARSTWQEVKTLALKSHHVAVATRAQGEQGIAAFLLGDTDTAKKLVLRPWGLSTALSIYEMQLIPAPRRCSLTEKKFARGVKKRLPQAAYIVDAQNRDILERVELERDSAFQYGRLLLDAGRGAFRSASPTSCEEESMLVLPCSHSPFRSRPGTSLLDFNQRF